MTVNMHEAKTQLSKLVEKVGRGESGTWSPEMRAWLEDGEAADLTISRADLGKVKRRKLF